MKKCVLTLFALGCCLLSLAQERVISGKVTAAEDATPLPGVNVLIKGTSNGTVTDTDGNYSIAVPSSTASLIFSFIGLRSAEIPVGEKMIVDVALALDIQQLNEIVVTGTGVATEKRKLAIAVESISASKLPAAPTASIDQALVGKIAGAQISSVSGDPGAQVQILLRGINTIQRGTTPMILVDGVQLAATSLSTLDLSSVEKVEVVQGAAAATIYGAQGANGVIQIFTKRGEKGKIKIDLAASIAQNEYLNVGGLSKAKLHAFETDESGNVVDPETDLPLTQDPLTLQYNGSLGYDPLDPTLTADKPYDANLKYYDHFSQFLEKAVTSNASIRISGASDAVNYSFIVSNNHQNSNIKNGGYNDRSNFTSNVGVELAKGLNLRTITQLVYTKNTVNPRDIYGVFNARPFVDFNLRNSQGFYGANYGGAAGVNGFNPNYWTTYSDKLIRTVDIIQNFNLNYKVNKFIELDTKYGLNYQRYEQIFTRYNETNNRTVADENGDPTTGYNFTAYNGVGPDLTGFVDGLEGEIDNFSNQTTFQNWLSKATVNIDLDKDFGIGIPLKTSTLVAFDFRKNVDIRYATYAYGLPVDGPFTAAYAKQFRVLSDYIANISSRERTLPPGPLTGKVPFVTYGYLVNQRFDYGEIGGVSAGFRSDYSSAFGRGNKPFTFPRADAYLRISELPFWEGSKLSNTILDWKLRAAYGKAGIPPFAFDRYPTIPAQTVGGVNGLKLSVNAKNPDLQVEVSKETEVGTDIVINAFDDSDWFSNTVFSFTYWKRGTDNAIWNVDIPPSAGGQILTNAISLESKGIQASLAVEVFKTSSFTWNLTTNFTKARSKISGVSSPGEVVLLSSAGSTNYVLKPGQKIGQLIGYLGLHSVNAVDPGTGQPYIPLADQGNYVVASNGWVVNKTSKQPYFTPNPYSFGDPNPKFNMSFINDFAYGDFLSFGFQLDWIQGSHLYNQTKEWMYRDGIHSDYNTPITINGETGAWTAFYRGVYAVVSRNGTKNYFYEDASFLRLRNVNVAVDLSKLTKTPFRSCQLLFTGRNLWTHTHYSGMDPEISSGTINSSWDRGTDHNTLPNFKSYQIGLNIGI